jgi:hypothetical protein
MSEEEDASLIIRNLRTGRITPATFGFLWDHPDDRRNIGYDYTLLVYMPSLGSCTTHWTRANPHARFDAAGLYIIYVVAYNTLTNRLGPRATAMYRYAGASRRLE